MQLAVWRRHPVSRAVLTFCAEYAEALAREHTKRWEENALQERGGEDEARGYMKAMRDLAGINHSAINQFYGVTLEEEKEPENEPG